MAMKRRQMLTLWSAVVGACGLRAEERLTISKESTPSEVTESLGKLKRVLKK